MGTAPNRNGVGAPKLRSIATKNPPCVDFPWRAGCDPHVVLELDHWALAPRRF